MNPRAKAVRPRDDYRLELAFLSGETGRCDCRPLLDFGMFRELRDLAYFRQVKAQLGAVVWPHQQDLCPDTLYLDANKSGPPPGA